MLDGWLRLVVYLLALAVVAYMGQAILKYFGAPALIYSIGAGLLLLVALFLIAARFGMVLA